MATMVGGTMSMTINVIVSSVVTAFRKDGPDAEDRRRRRDADDDDAEDDEELIQTRNRDADDNQL